MRNFAVYLMMALAIIVAPEVTAVEAGGLPARRSRFLTNSVPMYACSKKSAAVCLAPASPGPTCCDGRCVDTVASNDHCGVCNKVCKDGRVCCGGHCVDLRKDKDHCGRCFNQCNKKCYNGFCGYA